MEFTFKSKFNLEDVVWFMHENRPATGMICRIFYSRSESIDTRYEHKNIFHKIKSFLSKKDIEINLSYQLDMVDKDGKFISCPHYRRENEIFKNKQELLNSL